MPVVEAKRATSNRQLFEEVSRLWVRFARLRKL